MSKYNIFEEMKKEWPLWFRIKFEICSLPIKVKLKLSFLWCDIKQFFKQLFCKHEWCNKFIITEHTEIELEQRCYFCGKVKI